MGGYYAYLLLGSIVSFLFLALIFIPLEKTFPARPGQNIRRSGWFTDLCYFFGQHLFFGILVSWLLLRFGAIFHHVVPVGFRQFVGRQAWWLQCLELLFVSDLLIYWGHRLQHRVGFLWRFHKVHHSATQLDWLAAYREHPLDSVYTIGLINIPVFLVGFPVETISGFIAFRGIWAIYIHSNTRLPLGPFKYLIGSPELHHWHHDLKRDRGNYANISPIMDLIFGTHYNPGKFPDKYGIQEQFPQKYVHQLAEPLRVKEKNKSI